MGGKKRTKSYKAGETYANSTAGLNSAYRAYSNETIMKNQPTIPRSEFKRRHGYTGAK